MNIRMKHSVIELGRRQDLQVVDGSGTEVVCRSGGVWITQEHDTRDVILESGDSFVLDRPGLAIVRATARSTIVLAEPTAFRRGRMLTRLFDRWRESVGHAQSRPQRCAP